MVKAVKNQKRDAESSSSDDSSSESEAEQVTKKTVEVSKKGKDNKKNAKKPSDDKKKNAKKIVKADSSSDDDSSDEEMNTTPEVVKVKASTDAKKTKAGKKNDKKKEESSSDEDSSESEAEESSKKAAVTKKVEADEEMDTSSDDKKASSLKRKRDASAESSDDSSSSDSDEAEAEEEEGIKIVNKKAEQPPQKIQKTEGAEGEFTVLVKGMSFDATEEDIRSFFSECGNISAIEIERFEDSGKSRGVAKICFDESTACEAALEYAGSEMMGRNISVFPMKGKGKAMMGDRSALLGTTRTLFVGNMPFDVTEDDVWQTFGEFGTVTRVALPTDRDTGKFKGFGIVAFEDVEAVKSAMAQNGELAINGRTLRLDPSEERDRESSGGGRGGARGRGGFGGGRGRGGSRGGGFNGGARGGGRGGRGGNFSRGGGRGGSRGGFNKPPVRFGGQQNKKISFD